MSKKKHREGITVFLADDHAVVRAGLRLVLEGDGDGDIEVVGESGDGRSAVREVSRLLPDVAVLDVCMPEISGIDATRRIRELCPDTQVVILSMVATSEHVYQALSAGALGYVVKDSSAEEVVQAIRAVHRGERFLGSQISETLADAFVNIRKQTPYISPIERLSRREREVLHMVVQGKSSGDIAKTISLSPKTVDTYRSRIMEKLGVKGVPGLVKFAIEHGLIAID